MPFSNSGLNICYNRIANYRLRVKKMIQELAPKQVHIGYKKQALRNKDYIVMVNGSNIMTLTNHSNQVFPRYQQLQEAIDLIDDDLMYLFSIDDDRYYLYIGKQIESIQQVYTPVGRRELYNENTDEIGYIGYTASHVYDWLQHNRYCGRCGAIMVHRSDERGLLCKGCGLVRYPQISPVVIVGVQYKDKLLMTKYANRNLNRYALIAGFVEIGETLEAAVHREVFEEVGLRVKNLKYFASQPWGISGGLMTGFLQT